MHLEAQQAAASGRFDEEATAEALLAALPRHTGDVLLRAMQHWARLLGTGDAAAFTPALEARIFRDAHVSVFCHQLAVDPASCTSVTL
jgi:hypothetical protein